MSLEVSRFRGRRAVPWFLAMALSIASPLCAERLQEPLRLAESDLVFLQPWLGHVSLADAVTAYAAPGGTLVPLGEMCRLLAFPIEVEADRGQARGHCPPERRPFLLDLEAGVAVLGDQRIPLGPLAAVRQDREILVDSRLLEAWFTLAVKVDLKAATITFTSKDKLPLEEQWEREGRYAGLSSGPGEAPILGKALPAPYRLADVPFVDLATAWSRSRSGGAGQPQVSVAMAGDLLWMSSSLFLSRDSRGRISDSRATLYREDPHGALLGPLRAGRVELGDLMQSPGLDLVGDLPAGRGLLVDNYPMGYRSRFATRSFQGRLPEGWTVELHQNNALTGVQKSRPDGLYEFRDVPLRFGLNLFRLVFHGPMGERREETVRADIASDLPLPGRFHYRFAGVKPTRPDAEEEGAGDSRQVEEAWGRPAFMADVDYGLSRSFALNTGLAKVRLEDGDHRYRVVGLRGLFSYLSFQASAAQDAGYGRGEATERVLRSGYGYSSLSLRRTDYRHGFQPVRPPQDTVSASVLRSETVLDLFGTVTVKSHPVGIALCREIRQYDGGDRTIQDRVKASFSLGAWSLSPAVSRTLRSRQARPTPLDLALFASSFGAKTAFQGELNARCTDGRTALTGWQAGLDLTAASGVVYRLGLKGSDAHLDRATLLGGLNRTSGSLGYGVDIQYARSTGGMISLRAQASFGREPRTGRWVRDAQPMVGLGAASVVAFLDADGDGAMGPGESPLEDARFRISGQPVESALKDPRVAFKTQLPRAQEAAVQLDASSLEDPAMQATTPALRIVPRAGRVIRVDIPVARFGEIVGTTRIRREGGVSDYGGLELELLRASGEPVRIFRSAYDGFFEIRDLPLGDYLLRISPREAARLRLKDPPVRTFHVDSQTNLFEGQDLIVEQVPPPASPQGAAP